MKSNPPAHSMPIIATALVCFVLPFSSIARAQEAPAPTDGGMQTLEAVVVIDAQRDHVRIENAEELDEQRAMVPGGTNRITLDEAARYATLSDAIGKEPGVIVQEFFGGLDQPRLSVRGSGLQGNPVTRGVLLRQDHLPLNEADGSFILGVLDLRNTDMVTVNRGANSRVPGVFTLGGDINFIARKSTDRNAKVQFERGNFGSQALALAGGNADNEQSWRASYSESQSTGFRHHSDSHQEQLRFNLVSALSDQLTHYLYLSYTDLAFDMPFVLTREIAEQAPESVYGDGDTLFDIGMNIYMRDPHRATTQTRLAQRARLSTDDGEHMAGLYWQSTDDAFVDPFTHTETDTITHGAQWTFDSHIGTHWLYQMGIDHNASDMPRSFSGNHPFNGNTLGSAFAEFDLQAENLTYALNMDWLLSPDLTLTGQWQAGTAKRAITPRHNAAPERFEWHHNLPKAGFVYRTASGNSRYYGNISESREYPTFWEFIGINVNPALTWLSSAQTFALQPQEAMSVEMGTEQLIQESVQLSFSVYRSDIEKELLSTASQYGVIAETSNYDGDTRHQGVEFGVKGNRRLRFGTAKYQLSWTWSDFRFLEGVYQGNRIAGVPKHLIAGELLLPWGGARIGPTLRWIPGDNPVDHENSLYQDGYALWGAKANVQLGRHLRTYLAIDNLFDKNYVSTFVVRAHSQETLPTFLPGSARSAAAGVVFDL